MQSVADGYGDANTHHSLAQAANGVGSGDDCVQKGDAELLTDGIQNGAHQQGTEKTLGHSAQSVNAVPFSGKDNVLPFQECAEFVHLWFHSLSVE
jgi:hypothetical protein